jgi:hypothetical protein
MPLGGPFIPDLEIQEIEDWINAGCPDQALAATLTLRIVLESKSQELYFGATRRQ